MEVDLVSKDALLIMNAINLGYNVTAEVMLASTKLSRTMTIHKLYLFLGRLEKAGFIFKATSGYAVTTTGRLLFKVIHDKKNLMQCGHEPLKKEISYKNNAVYIRFICASNHASEWKKIAELPNPIEFKMGSE